MEMQEYRKQIQGQLKEFIGDSFEVEEIAVIAGDTHVKMTATFSPVDITLAVTIKIDEDGVPYIVGICQYKKV